MNFDKPLIEQLSAFDPDERTGSKTKSRMLKVADKLRKFSAQELLELDNEVTVYVSILPEKMPKFIPNSSRLDTDYFTKLWPVIEDELGRHPSTFVR